MKKYTGINNQGLFGYRMGTIIRYIFTVLHQRGSGEIRNLVYFILTPHWCTSLRDLHRIVFHYYSELYTSTHQGVESIRRVLIHVSPRVTDDKNRTLLSSFMEEDIRAIAFNLDPNRAPGPDSFSASFFQQTWQITGTEITTSLLKVLNGGVDL